MPFEPSPKTEQEQRVQIGRIALEAIAARILTVPRERVNMGLWCGTACCAIGHGMTLPEVQCTGLYFARNPRPDAINKVVPAYAGIADIHESIAAAFGITVTQSLWFFSDGDATARDVASRIREYLAA